MLPECRECGKDFPPRVNRCISCGAVTGDVPIYANPFWWDETEARELADQASHHSVSYDSLTDNSDGWTYTGLFLRPLIGYMWDGETPLYILHSKSKPVTIVDKDSGRGWETELDGARSNFLVSDQRFLFTSYTSEFYNDLLISIPYEEIIATSVADESERPSDAQALVIETEDVEYILPVSNSVPNEQLVDIAQSTSGGSDYMGNHEEQDALLALAALGAASSSFRELDDAIAASDSADEAIESLVDALESSWSQELSDSTVRNADSLLDLLAAQEALPKQGQGDHKDRSNLKKAATAGGAGVASGGVVAGLQSTLENADLAQAAMSGLEVGGLARPIAAAAPWSTPLVLGAIVAGGVATEIYKSGNDDTIVDDIDPAEVIRRARSGSSAGNKYDLGDVDGAKVGATISAARYVAENITSEEYLQLVMESDPEMMMEGAELGVKLSDKGGLPLGHRTGAAAGMAAGLSESYTDGDTKLTEESLEEILDEDLFYQYLGKISAMEGK